MSDISAIRSLIGSTTPPTDSDLTTMLADLGSTDAVALSVLSGRLADMTAQAAKFALDGDATVDYSANIDALTAQVARLRVIVGVSSSSSPIPYAGGLLVSEQDGRDPDLVDPYFHEDLFAAPSTPRVGIGR